MTNNITWTSGTLTIVGNNGDINLSATLTITGGEVVFDGGTGDIDIQSGGSIIVAEGATLTVPEDIEVQNGGSLTVNGTVTSGTFIEIDGGTVTVNSGGSMSAAGNLNIDDGGTLTVNDGGAVHIGGDLENNGIFDGDSQGTIANDGSIVVDGDVDIANTTPNSSLNGSGTLDVGGTFFDGENGVFDACPGFPCTSVNILSAPTLINNTSSFNVTFEWLYNVTGFTIDDIVVGNGSASNFSATDGNTYTADITPDGNGDITIDVGKNEVEEGNGAAFTVTVLYDIVGPTITFSNVPTVATASAFTLTINFDEDVQNFATGDIGVTNGTKGAFATVDAATYTQVITPTGGGDIVVSIGAAVADDLAGNSNTAADDLTIVYVASIAPGDVASPTLWLTADQGVTLNGATVSNWADQSGGGNNASQGTAATQPTLVYDRLNGNPALSFDGDDYMSGAAGFYTEEYFVVTVPDEIYNSGVSAGVIIAFGGTDFARLGLGPTSDRIDDEVITHAAGDGATGYRAAFAGTTVDLNQPAIINPRQNSGGNGIELYVNGTDQLNALNGTGIYVNYDDSDYVVGDEPDEAVHYPLNGIITEIISYDPGVGLRLPASDRRDIESYLAIKYGITLDVSTEDYTVGGSSIYDATAIYSSDIAGVGINYSSNLNQTSSKSENPGSILRIENASDLADGEFLVWGNNGFDNTFTSSNVPTGNSEIFEKVWYIQETGDVGTVSISFDITSLGIDLDNSTINLFILSSGATIPDDFASATVNSSGIVSNVDGRDLVTFSGVDFSDGDFFTIGGDIQTTFPGGSVALDLWLKAGAGVSSSGGLVSAWADQSGSGNDVSQGKIANQPTLEEDAINYNDAVYFNGDNLETISGANTQEYFVVIRPDVSIDNTTVNGFVMGFETNASSGFYVGDENIIGNDLFGQTLDNDGYDAAATAASLSDNVIIFNVRNDVSTVLYANGTSYASTTSGGFANLTNTPIRLGNNFDGDNAYEGYIAEVINYNSVLADAATRRDVETYLAIKYGVTLDLSSEDYTLDGSTIYDGSTFPANDIAGIGINLDYGLNQSKSISQNTGAIIKMESASDLDDQEYIVWGNDGGSKTTPQATEKPVLFDERLPAEWRVAVTGSPGAVTVKMYVGGIDDFDSRPQYAELYELLIDDDGDFSSVVSSVSASDLANDTLTFSSVNFSNGDYFTLALASEPDLIGMSLWLKADEEVEEGASNDAENGDVVQFWRDQSSNNNDVSQATLARRPTYNSAQLNGNPVVTFDDDFTYLEIASVNLNPRTIYVVYQDASADFNTTPFTNDDNDDGTGIGAGDSDGTNIFDTSNTPAEVSDNGANYANGSDIGDGTTQARPSSFEIHSRVFNSNLSNATWNYYVGNDRGTSGRSIGGSIAEIVVYDFAMTDTKRRDVETYLAIKYGITLDLTLDYTYNGGSTIYDNATFGSYNNDIAGIGSNSYFGLVQTTSQSNNSDAIVTISNASSQNNFDFLVWGNDDGATDEASSVSAGTPPGIGDRIERIWGVNETNNIGTVTVGFNLTGLGYGGYTTSEFTLILDDNDDFTDGILRSYTAQSFTADQLTFASVDFTGATHFGVGISILLLDDTDQDGIPDYFESAYGTAFDDGNDPVSGGAIETDTDDTTGPSGDGISDALEFILIANGATSPTTVFTDTDGDGIPDYLEVENGSSPFDPDAPYSNGDADSDGDGIPDALEILIAAAGGAADAVLNTDTDGDGVPDYCEVINDTDPGDINSPTASGGNDTDGDGITDAMEDILIAGGASSVSPTTDTDRDGIPDYVEAQTYTNPFDGASPVAGITSVRSLLADYEAAGINSVDISGYQWIDVTDQSGNLVFSINPFGNDLGATSWGIRVLGGQANVRNSGSIYYINRNWYIEPTIQPVTNVYVRFYALDQEVTDLTDRINSDQAKSLSEADILDGMTVLKVDGDTDLNPLVLGGSSTDEIPTVVDFSVATADVFVLELNSFSAFDPMVDASSPLPVELMLFQATIVENGVLLHWETASEQDNDFFTLERSQDGLNFNNVKEIPGAGNSSELLSYDYLDKTAKNGTYFYRLKQTDYDGQFTYSEIIAVSLSKDSFDNDLIIYPNPVKTNSFYMSVENLEYGIDFEVSILDLAGKTIKSQLLNRTSNNILLVSVEGLKSGLYIVRVKSQMGIMESRLKVER